MKRFLWGLVGVLTVLRLIGSYMLPLTGDEAYYWEWSRRLAGGYIDHPAGVAWAVAGFHFLGTSAGAVRFGFWLSGVVATIAMADCAARLARSRGSDANLASAVAALLTNIAPIIAIAFGTVSPDGPFLASWALTLDAATALMIAPSLIPALGTGVAIGIGLETRAFAVALLCGVLVALRKQRGIALIVFAVATVCAIPLLWWNATHQWAMLIFTLVGRHVDEGFSIVRPFLMFAEVLLAFGIGPAIAVIWGGILGIRRDISSVMVWTSLPLVFLLLGLSFIERVETYWLLGPYLSLSIVTAVMVAEKSFLTTRAARFAPVLPALFLLGILYLLIFANGPIADIAATRFHARLHKAGAFNIYAFGRLAHDINTIAASRNALVFTDGYGLSSLLDYYGNITPVVIGYDWQGREARRWFTDAPVHGNGLFVDLAPLVERPDFATQLARACGHVLSGPLLQYTKGNLPQMVFPTTWCLDMKPNAIAILRWEQTR